MNYKRKLTISFFIFSIIVTLIIALIAGGFLFNMSTSKYKNTILSTHSSIESNSEFSMMVILKSLYEIMSDARLAKWMNSADKNHFNYYAISAQKCIQTKTTSLSPIQFNISVYMKNETSDLDMVITGNTTMATKDFLKHCNISPEQFDDVKKHFENSISPYCIPSYQNDGLKSIYYIIKDTFNNSNGYYFITFPVETLIGNDNKTDFIIYNEEELIAVSSKHKDKFKYFNEIYKEVDKNEDFFSAENPVITKNFYIMHTSNDTLNWNILYLFDTYSIEFVRVIFFFIVILFLFFIILYFVFQMLNRIYKPIHELVIELTDNYGNCLIEDEFKAIRYNISMTHALNKSLMNAQIEYKKLISQHNIKNILLFADGYMYTPSNLDSNISYYVALIILSASDMEDNTSINSYNEYKNNILEICLGINYCKYIDISLSRCALVIDRENEEEVRSMLNQMFQKPFFLEEQNDLTRQIILSSNREKIDKLHLCYMETIRISEYCRLFPNTEILTYNQISDIDAIVYSYPLATENKLIQFITEGKEESLTIFDDLIRVNIKDKDLSRDSLQSFVYSLIGTIHRIFQELKTSPKELLHKKIDFKYWYNHWNNSNIIGEIKETIRDIIQEVNINNNNVDKKILHDMLDYVYKNYTDDIMLNDMAQHLNLSPKYCGILFKQLSESNFKDFLNRYRIEKAKDIIFDNPQIKILDLSKMVGFNSSNTFIRVFNKYTGLTPKTYCETIAKSNDFLSK